MKQCRACAKSLEIKPPVGRKDVCPFCGAELRCCLNCHFYAPALHHACREPQAEQVMEKDRSNFCDYFVFRDAALDCKGAQDKTAARAKLDSLFK